MLGSIFTRLPRWLRGTIVGAIITSSSLRLTWSSFSSAFQRLDGNVQASLITICAAAVGGIFYNLIVREKEIKDEWEPWVGLVGGCFFVLLVALIAALLQPSAPSPVLPAMPTP